MALGILMISAWVVLFAWQRSIFSGLMGHEALGDHHISLPWQMAGFFLSWSLMVVAMMLPGSLPVILQASQRASRSGTAGRMTANILAGYLVPWMLFGLLVFQGDRVLHNLAEHGGPLEPFTGWILPVLALAAGLYQLSPLKHRSLAGCRLETTAVEPALHASSRARVGWERGLHLGAVCLGSCWPLMLVMVSTGLHRLDWMLAMGVIMAAERIAPWGNRLARWVGFGLIAWAIVMGSAPPHLHG